MRRSQASGGSRRPDRAHGPALVGSPVESPLAGPVRSGTPAARWVLAATVVGSGMALLDGTVVNVALPAIGRDLQAPVSGLQWVLAAYLVTLTSLLLAGGALGDVVGRRRVFLVGAVWFAVASAACAAAPDLGVLVAARAVQGIGGALLVPGSLAIIESTFAADERGRAIGLWAGLGGVAAAVGPLIGGWLVTAASWRLIFVLNLPLASFVLGAGRHVAEPAPSRPRRRVDVQGAALGAGGLAGVTYALIQGPAAGSGTPVAVVAGVAGAAALVAFVVVEGRRRQPLLPLSVFRSRQFSGANAVTFVVYAALGGGLFLVAIELQQVVGYSPLAAGAAMVPITLLMLVLSPVSGTVGQRVGPRWPMTAGPLVMAAGLLLMRRFGPGVGYAAVVLPAVVVFGLGLVATVAPLTATALGALDEARAGMASGVNNAVARLGSLLAVAVLPALSGVVGAAYRQPARFDGGFRTAVTIAAGLCVAGAGVAAATIRRPGPTHDGSGSCSSNGRFG